MRNVFIQYGVGATYTKNRFKFFWQGHPTKLPHRKIIFQLELVYERP